VLPRISRGIEFFDFGRAEHCKQAKPSEISETSDSWQAGGQMPRREIPFVENHDYHF